jgi:peptidoglycan/xylan/chitin deacetylase (PgdA/CDA1 family)
MLFEVDKLRALEMATLAGTLPAVAVTAGAVACAAGLAWGGLAYCALWPESQIFGETLIAPERPGEIALTYDDGPNPAWTPQLLDILARHNIKATFFLIGSYAAREAALVRQMAAAGHVIGNHSWHHPNLALTPRDRVWNELVRTKATLEGITGKEVRLFRPPFGARRPAVLHIARSMGLTPVMWNCMTSDWSTTDPELIAKRLIAKVEKNWARGVAANVVLHDGSHLTPTAYRGPSITATKRIISQYKRLKKFVTVEDWV